MGCVLDDAARLDAARRGEDDLRPGVVDAGRQLRRGEPAEDHRVDRADPRAGQHGDDRLGDHRHVDDHAVALPDARTDQGAGEPAHVGEQLRIRDGALRAGDRRVVVDGDLLAAAGVDVPVERVEAGVERGAREPPVERRPRVVEHPVGWGDPVDVPRGLAPEPLRVLETAHVRRGVDTGAHALETSDTIPVWRSSRPPSWPAGSPKAVRSEGSGSRTSTSGRSRRPCCARRGSAVWWSWAAWFRRPCWSTCRPTARSSSPRTRTRRSTSSARTSTRGPSSTPASTGRAGMRRRSTHARTSGPATCGWPTTPTPPSSRPSTTTRSATPSTSGWTVAGSSASWAGTHQPRGSGGYAAAARTGHDLAAGRSPRRDRWRSGSDGGREPGRRGALGGRARARRWSGSVRSRPSLRTSAPGLAWRSRWSSRSGPGGSRRGPARRPRSPRPERPTRSPGRSASRPGSTDTSRRTSSPRGSRSTSPTRSARTGCWRGRTPASSSCPGRPGRCRRCSSWRPGCTTRRTVTRPRRSSSSASTTGSRRSRSGRSCGRWRGNAT